MKHKAPKKLVLATGNKGKLIEFQQMFANLNCEVTTKDAYYHHDVKEVGLTFVENAILKARVISEASGMPTLGDDSGLVVPALEGRPGIYSARFAGENATDQENIEKLLEQLSHVSNSGREAYYICVIALLKNSTDPSPLIFHGYWEGEILHEPQGHGGFGYDPIFYCHHFKKSAAQLTLDEKNSVSHRAKAINKLITFWEE